MRRRILASVTAVVLLALGAGVAVVLDDALGIRTEPAEIPVEHASVVPARDTALPPQFTRIDAPDIPRVAAAVDELRDAVAGATATSGTATLTVTAGDEGGDLDEYTVTGTRDALSIRAVTEAGAARGIYDLAEAVRYGRSVSDLIGRTVTSRLPFRMVDLGAVGVEPDAAEWLPGTNYSHASGAFRNVFLADAPYIDAAAVAQARTDFDAYARHMAAEGYTAIAFPGLIEYLSFGDANDARAAATREAFAPFWQDAQDLGLDIFLRTDMLTLTPELDQTLRQRFGKDVTDPELWKVYTDALADLYAAAPALDGVLIRIGEAGNVYDVPGLPYFSELAVTTVPAVRAMLTAFSEAAERTHTEVIFRSWSVGVGAVGDMHTDPESYHAVLDGLDSPALIVSTKYTLGDFYSHVPLNVTLETGDQRRIIEFQSRREFEAFGAFPNDLGDLYQQAIQRFVAANPKVEGIWTWTQDGGPWRAGPMSLELKSGFWQLYELNTILASRLARVPDTDPAEVTADWARRYFSDDPATVTAIAKAMAASRSAITDGLYIGPYADKKVYAIGLEPPPMMWIFEWDIVTGDSAVLDVIYDVSKDDLDEAIAGGQRALDAVDAMGAAIGNTDEATWRSPELRAEFLAALSYEHSTLEVLGAYREMVLRQGHWHDTGDGYDAWQTARDRYEQAAAAHLAEWSGDVQHPPLNLVAADLGASRADRDLAMAWAARVLLVLVVAWLVFGLVRRRGAAWVHLVAAVAPWRAADAVAGLGARDRVLLVAVPALALVASRGILTWFDAWAHFVVVLAALALFLCGLSSARSARVETPRRLSSAQRARIETPLALLAPVGGITLLRSVLLLTVLTPTGPGGYWFHFWTDPTGRFVYVTLAFALFAWLIVAPAWTLATMIGMRRALGSALAGIGLVLALIGGFIAAVGLEQALTVWNDQLGLLPWGLSRILGITTYLEIPSESAPVAALAGALLLVVGILLARVRRLSSAAEGDAYRNPAVPRALVVSIRRFAATRPTRRQ